jgi:hypothetical protein
MDDGARDDRGDGAWMTYKQLAEVRHISPRAAVRMTQRHRLRRQPGNDGQVLVWVPHDMAEPSQRQSQRDDRGDDARDTGLLAAFEDAVAGLRGQLDATNARADRAEAALTEANRRAASALSLAEGTLAQLADTNARADRAEGRVAAIQTGLDVARTEARAARERAEAAEREIDARKARGLLARLRAAVRGE